VTKKSRMH